MNTENTNRMFRLTVMVILTVIGYLCGGITEYNEHAEERRVLVDSIDILTAKLDHVVLNTDYNALFNLEASEITEKCSKCAPMLQTVQFRLDSLEIFDGKLVVPKPTPES